MPEKEGSLVETLIDKLGSIPTALRIILEDAHLERVNSHHVLYHSRSIDARILEPFIGRISEIVGTTVSLQHRPNGNGSVKVEAPADPRQRVKFSDTVLPDMIRFEDLRRTFSSMPFEVFSNNRAAAELLQRTIIEPFPDPLPEKMRPFVFVGGVGIGKTYTLEHAVYSVEVKRHKAIAALKEPDYGKALELAKGVAGSKAQSERELWDRVLATASTRILYESAQRIKDNYQEIGKLAADGKTDLLNVRSAAFRSRHNNLDLWAIDDIQSFADGNPAKTLEWFFGSMEGMYARRRAIITTSDRSPDKILAALPHTSSRLTENICDVLLPTDDDKLRYARMKFSQLKAKGCDLGAYEESWIPVIVKVADHYRHINSILNNIHNNGGGQQSLWNPSQLFEQALDKIGKEKNQAHAAYDAQRIITLVTSLSGVTERELKRSEADHRRYKMNDAIAAKRTALVLIASRTDRKNMPYEDLALIVGYQGLPQQRAETVKKILGDYCDIINLQYVPIENQYVQAHQQTVFLLQREQGRLL